MKTTSLALSALALAFAALGSAQAATPPSATGAATSAAAAPSPTAAADQATQKASTHAAAKTVPTSTHRAAPKKTKHPAQPAKTTHKATPKAMQKAAYRPVSGSVRLHDRVVEARAAQQRHWIAVEQHRRRLDAAQAASLRRSVAVIERDQQALRRQGQETLPQALAMSHRQDILDWAIRSARVDFEPQRIASLDATA